MELIHFLQGVCVFAIIGIVYALFLMKKEHNRLYKG